MPLYHLLTMNSNNTPLPPISSNAFRGPGLSAPMGTTERFRQDHQAQIKQMGYYADLMRNAKK